MKKAKRFAALFLSILMVFAIIPKITFASDVSTANVSGQSRSFYHGETVSLGRHHSLAIRQDGSLWAWGWNNTGQIGDGTNINNYVPVPVDIDAYIIAVSAGYTHSMALDNNGGLWVWGNDYYLLCENSPLSDASRYAPQLIMENVIAIAAGNYHSMAIKEDGSLWTWGYNTYGVLGIGEDVYDSMPTKIMDNVVAIAAEDNNSFAIKEDGSLWAWGWSLFTSVADNENKRIPVKIMDDVVSVSAGESHVVAVKNDGSLWSWPWIWGNYSITGDMVSAHDMPIKIMDDMIVAAAGNNNTWAVKSDNSLWAWGYGILGDGGEKRSSASEPVHVMDDVFSVTANSLHAMAITKNGYLYAWGHGDRDFSRIGDGTADDRYSPVRIFDDVMLPPYQRSLLNKSLDVIKVFLNGTRVIFDQQPIIEDGRVLTPAVGLANAMGATVSWDDKTKTLTIHLDEKEVIMTQDVNSAQIVTREGKTTQYQNISLEVPMRIIDDVSYVPLQLIERAFNARVDWDGGNNTVYITVALNGEIVLPAEGGVLITNANVGRGYSIYMPIKMAEAAHEVMQGEFVEDYIIGEPFETIAIDLATYYGVPYLGALIAIYSLSNTAYDALTLERLTYMIKKSQPDDFIVMSIMYFNPNFSTDGIEINYRLHESAIINNPDGVGKFIPMSAISDEDLKNILVGNPSLSSFFD